MYIILSVQIFSLKWLKTNDVRIRGFSTSKHHRNEDTIKPDSISMFQSNFFGNISPLAPNTDIYPYFALETPLLTPQTLLRILLPL